MPERTPRNRNDDSGTSPGTERIPSYGELERAVRAALPLGTPSAVVWLHVDALRDPTATQVFRAEYLRLLADHP